MCITSYRFRSDIIFHLFGAGDAVVNVYINHEKKFAFVEMRSVEEASNAMALDGIIFEVFNLLLCDYMFLFKYGTFLELLLSKVHCMVFTCLI